MKQGWAKKQYLQIVCLTLQSKISHIEDISQKNYWIASYLNQCQYIGVVQILEIILINMEL
jgi:hypothetical protein